MTLQPDDLSEAIAQEHVDRVVVMKLAEALAEAASRVWHFGDGEGGWVREYLEAKFDDAGLRSPGRARGGRMRLTAVSSRALSADERARILARDELRCQRCGAEEGLTVDHIYPRSKGGGNEPENLQTLCQSCNSKKGARV